MFNYLLIEKVNAKESWEASCQHDKTASAAAAANNKKEENVKTEATEAAATPENTIGRRERIGESNLILVSWQQQQQRVAF